MQAEVAPRPGLIASQAATLRGRHSAACGPWLASKRPLRLPPPREKPIKDASLQPFSPNAHPCRCATVPRHRARGNASPLVTVTKRPRSARRECAHCTRGPLPQRANPRHERHDVRISIAHCAAKLRERECARAVFAPLRERRGLKAEEHCRFLSRQHLIAIRLGGVGRYQMRASRSRLQRTNGVMRNWRLKQHA